MVVDRLGLGMLVLGSAGIVWLARPPALTLELPTPAVTLALPTPAPRAPALALPTPAPRAPALALPACDVSPMGGEAVREPMQGPFGIDLGMGCDDCLDFETVPGSAPIDELTVLRVGIGTPGLGSQHHLELAIRIGEHWYVRELGSIGPICGGLGSPTWLEATADAPQLCALGDTTAVTVRVRQTADRGGSQRTWSREVSCSLDETGTPSCTERAVP